MRTFWKPTLATVLAITMLLSLFPLAVWGQEASGYGPRNMVNVNDDIWANADETIYPTIILPGISQSYSFLADADGNPVVNANGEELGGGMFILDSAKTLSIVLKNLVPALLLSLFTQQPGKMKEATAKTMQELFAIQSTNKDGTPKNNLKTEFYDYPISGMTEKRKEQFYKEAPCEAIIDRIGEDNIYFFAYPLIGNPTDSGKKLHEYIQMVKTQRGVNKVNLLTLSLGGTILTSYLDLNEADDGVAANPGDINRIINAVSLLDGTEIMSDFFARNFNLEDDFIFQEFFPIAMGELSSNSMVGSLVNILIHALPRKGFEQTLTGLVDGVLEGLMLYNPQFWAMVESNKYEELAARYLNTQDTAIMRAKTDRFQKARLNLRSNLTKLHDDYGVITNNLCAYDLQFDVGAYNFFSIMKSSQTTNSDAVIQLASTSLGATYAPAGQTLSDAYLAEHAGNYISPNKGVDASTCLFPDNTWFFEDQHHEAAGNDVAIELMLYIAAGAIDDVNSCPELYPQFNSTRTSKNVARSLVPKAEDILANPADYPNADDETLSALEAALQNALTMLEQTNIYTALNCANTEKALQKAIDAATGEKKTSSFMDILNSMLAKCFQYLDALVYLLVGAKGFLD